MKHFVSIQGKGDIVAANGIALELASSLETGAVKKILVDLTNPKLSKSLAAIYLKKGKLRPLERLSPLSPVSQCMHSVQMMLMWQKV